MTFRNPVSRTLRCSFPLSPSTALSLASFFPAKGKSTYDGVVAISDYSCINVKSATPTKCAGFLARTANEGGRATRARLRSPRLVLEGRRARNRGGREKSTELELTRRGGQKCTRKFGYRNYFLDPSRRIGRMGVSDDDDDDALLPRRPRPKGSKTTQKRRRGECLNSPTCWPRDVTARRVGVAGEGESGSAKKEEEGWDGNRKTASEGKRVRERERERGREASGAREKGRKGVRGARGRQGSMQRRESPGGQNLRIPAGYRAIRRNTRSRGPRRSRI